MYGEMVKSFCNFLVTRLIVWLILLFFLVSSWEVMSLLSYHVV